MMIETCVLTSRTTTGDPDVTLDDDGDLHIYPTGVNDGGLSLFMSPADWDVLCAAVAEARRLPKPAGDLLALASAANEAAIAYRNDVTNEENPHSFAVALAAKQLLKAVDALTGAVVEAANDAGWNQ